VTSVGGGRRREYTGKEAGTAKPGKGRLKKDSGQGGGEGEEEEVGWVEAEHAVLQRKEEKERERERGRKGERAYPPTPMQSPPRPPPLGVWLSVPMRSTPG